MQFAKINFNCNLFAAVVALIVVVGVVVVLLGYHCRIFLGQLTSRSMHVFVYGDMDMYVCALDWQVVVAGYLCNSIGRLL